MKNKKMLKIMIGISLVVVMAIAIPLTTGCTSQAPTPEPTPTPTPGEPTPTPTPEPAQDLPIYKWRITSPFGAPDTEEDMRLNYADILNEMSGGRIKIQVYAGGELVPPLGTFDAVSQGTVEVGSGASYYWAGKVPAGQWFSAVPFGFNPQGINAWFYSGGALQLWEEVYAPFNLVPRPQGNTGVQMGGWFRKKIESVADFKGLKMRIPGLGGKVVAKEFTTDKDFIFIHFSSILMMVKIIIKAKDGLVKSM